MKIKIKWNGKYEWNKGNKNNDKTKMTINGN